MANCIKVNSFNARGLADGKKRRCIFRWLKKSHHGICFLQETHSTELVESIWKKEWGNEILFSHGTNKSKGVAILFPSKLDYIVNSVKRDDNGRFILLDLDVANTNIIMANVYAPTKDKVKDQIDFLQQLQAFLIDFQERNLLLGGDFNTCLDPTLDKKGGKFEKVSDYGKQLSALLEDFNLTDVWRLVNPDLERYTWRNYTRCGYVQSRIDYFFTSVHMLYELSDTDIKPGIKSDHSLLKIHFKLYNTQDKGKGFWKFNASLLHDKDYIDLVKKVITENEQRYPDFKNKALLWDVIKCDIRSHTVSYSSFKAKQKRIELNKLNLYLEELEIKLSDGEPVIDDYNKAKKDLEKFLMEKSQGHFIRSRAIHIEQNEKSNKYFLQQEIKNANIKNIKCLKTSDNCTINDPKEILKEQKTFYETLYSRSDHNPCNNCHFLNQDTPKLSEIDKLECDTELTLEECGKALKDLANNKAPGTDGFTANFLKFFWKDIKHHLFNSFMYSFKNGQLSLDQRRAILTLLPKAGKDIRWLKNWRPLSLLNTDYKILAKLFASRLQKVLPKLISEDQVAYIKDRYIGENVRKIIDIFDFTSNLFNPGIALFLDFEKAFDTVSWSFLIQTLKTFNFGQNFVKWVEILYNKPLSMVTNNGHSSEPFELGRGVRQGCPLSALLFILVAELMAINIRNNENIKPIKIRNNNLKVKITQMADDTTIFVKDVNSVKIVLKTLEHFSQCAGLKLNRDKTEAIQLGLHTEHIKSKFGIKWVEGPTKVIGVWVGKDNNVLYEKNIKTKIDKLNTLLNMWKARNITIKGKITVLKNLALPLLLYPFTVLHTKEEDIKAVDKLFFDFIWPNNKHHIKKCTIIQNIENGGLNMPDFLSTITAIKLTWVKKLMYKNNSFTDLVKALTEIQCLKTFLTSKPLNLRLDNFPPFYKDIFNKWFNFYCTEPTHPFEILNEPLWNNKYITVGNNTVHNKQWEKEGISKLYSLLDNNGNYLSTETLNRQYDINIDYMLHNSLKSAIPRRWLKKINSSVFRKFKDKLPDIIICKNNVLKELRDFKCKHFYQIFVQKKIVPLTSCAKWETLYPQTDFDWSAIFQMPYTVARETSLQSFHYKVLHRYLACKNNLYKWKKAASPLCPHCQVVDNIEHHLYECKELQHFWACFFDWLYQVCSVRFTVTTIEILFGISNDNKDDLIDVFNYCILFAKNYIYICKVNDSSISLITYKQELFNRLEGEKVIASMQNKLADFVTKWSSIVDNLKM